MEKPSPWWNSDILKVERTSDGDDIDVCLNNSAPPLDSFIQALIAVRFLLARHNLEPRRVVLEFGEESDTAEIFRERLRGCATEHADGSFSWGGFLFRTV